MKSTASIVSITALFASPLFAHPAQATGEIPPNTFTEVAKDDVGGHYFSQVIYAPPIDGLVTWGTRSHAHKIRAHETQHFLVDKNRWIDAWPIGKENAWAGKYKRWGDWRICATVGEFYTRDGVPMPRPNSTFYQCCWDEHNKRIVYYVGSMTYSYDPTNRKWKLIHPPHEKQQPPAMLLWSSLCYDPVNKQVILFGGGGVTAKDGRPHTWALDAKNDKWHRLNLKNEPPPRCNSRMVYDRKNQVIVLFGGDGQDRGLADTWLFDCKTQKWREAKPPRSPHPRSCHAMAYLDKSGVVLMAGGLAVAPHQKVRQLSRQAWVYDVAKNRWTPVACDVPAWDWATMENIPGTDEVVLVTANRSNHGRSTFRFRYDSSKNEGKHKGVPPGRFAYKTERTKAWYDDQPSPNRKAHEKRIASLAANQWTEMKPPKSAKGRTWGTSLFDVDHSIAMKWGGGHSGYQGTDMVFYDVAANRITIDRTPAFTPEPFRKWARRPAGRTFFNQPWARHMRHTCAYDVVAKLGVFSDAGGARWYDRDKKESVMHTWLYHPDKREWLEPIPQPFPGGGTISPIAVPIPNGVVVYQRGEMFRFTVDGPNASGARWQPIEIRGKQRPRHHEHMTIVYDSKRDRLVFLSEEKDETPRLWFFDMKDRQWVPNPKPASGGVVSREAVHIPNQDAILAYGGDRRRKNDPIWTRVYLCSENRWVPLKIKTPEYTVHEVGLEYDPTHDVAVLMWPPRFERDLRPHLFRLDVSKIGK